MLSLTNKIANRRPDFCSRYENDPDEFGFDLDFFLTCEPAIRFLYEKYLHARILGIENIPADGRAILMGNHSGGIPIDAFLFNYAFYNLHSAPRRIRFLANEWLLTTPCFSKLVRSIGAVPANYDIAKTLLQKEELVMFYPEGERGTGKHFSQRYRLCDFDSGFVKAALETGSAIVPIITVGAEELYPVLANVEPVARLLGAPYWPLSIAFPWLPFPLSAIPLPVRILIKVCKPIRLDYPKEAAKNRALRHKITKEIQYEIQRELNSLLRTRKSLL